MAVFLTWRIATVLALNRSQYQRFWKKVKAPRILGEAAPA
jgi:hypothetical protein